MCCCASPIWPHWPTASSTLDHAAGDPMYGISGYNASRRMSAPACCAQGKLEAKAGEQGWAGAPLAWSTAGYGVLADMRRRPVHPDARHSIEIAAARRSDQWTSTSCVGAPKAIFARGRRAQRPHAAVPEMGDGLHQQPVGHRPEGAAADRRHLPRQTHPDRQLHPGLRLEGLGRGRLRRVPLEPGEVSRRPQRRTGEAAARARASSSPAS